MPKEGIEFFGRALERRLTWAYDAKQVKKLFYSTIREPTEEANKQGCKVVLKFIPLWPKTMEPSRAAQPPEQTLNFLY
jgi:hypothetical protein